MNHKDRVGSLEKGVAQGGAWADFGSGTGAFTLALAELIGEQGAIYSIDKNSRALETKKMRMQQQYP